RPLDNFRKRDIAPTPVGAPQRQEEEKAELLGGEPKIGLAPPEINVELKSYFHSLACLCERCEPGERSFHQIPTVALPMAIPNHNLTGFNPSSESASFLTPLDLTQPSGSGGVGSFGRVGKGTIMFEEDRPRIESIRRAARRERWPRHSIRCSCGRRGFLMRVGQRWRRLETCFRCMQVSVPNLARVPSYSRIRKVGRHE